MIPANTFTLTAALHAEAQAHLFPGDGLEAAGLMLCSRAPGNRSRLLSHTFIPVPHNACRKRTADAIIWPGEFLETAVDVAEAQGYTIIAMHSHPGGLFAFSDADDESDARVMPSLFQAFGSAHGSAVMVPGGAVRARIYSPDMVARDLDLVTMAHHNISYWWANGEGRASRPLTFTAAMTTELSRLTAVVVGVSGTGSIVAEQLARLGFGRVILIDFDKIERKNLNRILNARLVDADHKLLKVDMFAGAIASYRGPGIAVPLPASVTTREAVETAAMGDVLFSCVDTLEARQIADMMGAAFLMPMIDVGVVIPTRKSGNTIAIADACGRIDYVFPGGSTLLDRNVYSPARVRAEYLLRTAPDQHQEEVQAGYIKGLVEEAPAVITLNMRAAAAAVNEYIARAYPFRLDANENYARTEFSLAACEEEYSSEEQFKRGDNTLLARGDLEPMLGLPALKRSRNAAA
ncbi:ThiF family adenylyltransferase [Bradyrhizobium sp. CCGE-LA001]|uniref:ThiF family adenylyltransferase n=1 Tax=Bradyrhizobium sp. CCGE-LA001 TaxID=1223566 RepID=UPI0002AAD3EA|nr:ThiF family adenylyltransferase [Bradyrhizobium sp. CCGE-LA001]AMA60070.1 thiamine biosynthesis protein ThiF [Bradyrhizobium sp. CCGE-LA001]